MKKHIQDMINNVIGFILFEYIKVQLVEAF